MYQFFTGDFAGLSADLWNWIVTGICIILLVLLIIAVVKFLRGPRLGRRRGRDARLAVTDAMAIGDDRRKLVLVRRDNIEHLLLIGGPSDVVIETNIGRTVAKNQASQPASNSFQPPQKVEPAVEKTTNPATLAKSDTPPTRSIEGKKASEGPAPASQPIAPAPATSVAPPTPSSTASVAAAAPVIVAPIVVAATKDNSTSSDEVDKDSHQPTKELSATTTEAAEKKLNPVEEMDALLTEISTDK